MRTLRNSLVTGLVLLLVISCASLLKNSYFTLSESKWFYDAAMTTVSDLQELGLITKVERAEINRVAKIYKEAHNTAVEALIVYERTSTAEDQDKLSVAMAKVISKWTQLAKLINLIKPDSVPLTLPK